MTTRPIPNRCVDNVRVDQICDRFEASWKDNSPETIESFLESVGEDRSDQLIYELIQLEVWYRTQNGETPTVREYCTRFPQVPLDRMPFTHSSGKGAVFSEIELERIIASGAFGDVWKAFDHRVKRDVAVKRPRVPVSLDSEDADLFRREAESAARLDHPNIVQVYGVAEFDGHIGIVLQLIDGPTLKSWRARNTPSSAECAEIVHQLALALAHAHERRVIHRDIKPGNILMAQNDRPMLTDFGLARMSDTHSTLYRPGVAMGTPVNMSPEQALGQPVDERSDTYSLGTVLFELLTGRPLFEGPEKVITECVLKVEPEPPRSINPSTHIDLEAICLKAVSKTASKRYQTAAEFAEDLQRYLNNERVSAPRQTLARRLLRQYRGVMAATLVCAVLLLCLLMYGMRETTHRVGVLTDPPGAMVILRPLDEQTGYPVNNRKRWVYSPKTTPFWTDLAPGQYLLAVPGGGNGIAEVVRTVPDSVTGRLPHARNYRAWKKDADGAIRWEPVSLSDKCAFSALQDSEQTVLIPATSRVTLNVDGTSGGAALTTSVNAFHVCIREFNVDDFTALHGNQPQQANSGRAGEQALTARFDEAMQWAENAGGRLLTEIEFEYLAILVHAAAKNDVETVGQLTDRSEAEAAQLQQSLLRIRGVFGGQAEWVWGRPTAFRAWAGEPADGNPHKHVLRGGNPAEPGVQISTQKFQLNRWVRYYHCRENGCGFRLAKSHAGSVPSRSVNTASSQL